MWYLKDVEFLVCYFIFIMIFGGGVNIMFMIYVGMVNVGLVCCNKNIELLQLLVCYVKEVFDMFEVSVDDFRLNIDDIGEQVDIVFVFIVLDYQCVLF